MIKYVLKQNHNEKSVAYGKYYAFPVVEETMDLEDLAHHMEEHNTGFSEAMCVGVMKAMVKCIKEQLLAGKNVKIDNLAIFSCGIKNREGAVSPEEFNVTNNISGVKLRARATGTLSNANLNLAASIKKASTVVGGGTGGDGNTPNGGGSNGGQQSGGQNTTRQYTITVTSADTAQGTVTGGGTYSEGSRVNITATPKSGYQFDKWSDGNTQATRTVQVSKNESFVAQFKVADSTGNPGGNGDDAPPVYE